MNTQLNSNALTVTHSFLIMLIMLTPVYGQDDVEPGQLVIIREVTPLPHNRQNPHGEIKIMIDLRSQGQMEKLDGGVNSFMATPLTDAEVAVVRSTPNPGSLVTNTLNNNSPLLHGDAGRNILRSSDMNGRLTQPVAGSGSAGGTVNKSVSDFTRALGDALGAINK